MYDLLFHRNVFFVCRFASAKIGVDGYEKAEKVADEAIELYESFNFLYITIINELKLFDSNGNLRDRKEAEENIQAGLSLIEELGHTKITKTVNKVYNV